MPVVSEPPRAVYAAAVETLCGSVVRALTGTDDAFRLADQLPPEDSMAGLAAVRVLGPDALTPFTLGGHLFGPDDAAVIATSIATFPLFGPDSGCHEGPMPVRQLRDWATSQLLARLSTDDLAHSYPTRTGSGSGPEPDWREWTATLAQLSPLASPGLDCPVHTDAQRRRLDTARGITRAMLRRDHLTAARLTRWLAASGIAPMDLPFLLEPVLGHLELIADSDTRLQLEIVMARRGLEHPVGG